MKLSHFFVNKNLFAKLILIIAMFLFHIYTISAQPINANNDNYVALQGVPLSLDFLENDIFTPPIDIEIISEPENGEISFNPFIGYFYVSDLDFTGFDFIGYEICNEEDSEECSTALITIEVLPYTGIVEANDDFAGILTNEEDFICILCNDFIEPWWEEDIEITIISLPNNGFAELVEEEDDFYFGDVYYEPNEDFIGEDSLSYELCNSFGVCDTATLYLYIDDEIVFDDILAINDFYITTVNTPIELNLLSNDIFSSSFEIEIIQYPEFGELEDVDFSGLFYFPEEGFVGTDYFEYMLIGDEGISIASVYIWVIEEDEECVESCVYAGDANNDGVANHYDLLNIGLGYGLTGPERPDASLEWVAQFGLPWDETISITDSTDTGLLTESTTNAKYADCNGDGIIDEADVVAIELNFGFTQGKTSEEVDASGPNIRFNLPEAVEANSWVEVEIILGEVESPIESLYGLAFTFNYDASIIDASSVAITYDNESWISGSDENTLTISQNIADAAKVFTAFSRTDGVDVSGAGKIANGHFFIIDNIDGKDEWIQALEISASDAIYINSAGEFKDIEGDIVSLDVMSNINEYSPNLPANNGLIKVSPNPSHGFVNVSCSSVIEQLIVYDLSGNIVFQNILSSENNNSEFTLYTNNLVAGMYLLEVRNKAGRQSTKLIVH